MNIELISYRGNIKSDKKNDLTVSLINNSEADILLFPGHTVNNLKDIGFVASKIKNKNSTAFLELKEIGARKVTNWSFVLEKGNLINCSSHQLFSTSEEINSSDYCAENLLYELKYKRIHVINGKKVCLLICGELNILMNIQSQENKVAIRTNSNKMKNEFIKLFKGIDIFLNPIHTPMGNQGKMKKRRIYLSSNNRAYFSTSNLVKSVGEADHSFKTMKALQYAYRNGKEINCIYSENTDDFLIRKYEIP